MTKEDVKHIFDVAFGVPCAVRRSGEDRTYHEDEIREAKNMAIKALSALDEIEKEVYQKDYYLYVDDIVENIRQIIRRLRG